MSLLPRWANRSTLRRHGMADGIAGVVVGFLVIPQSLGYALLAGLPPVYGLYAAILPTILYAWVGASNTQAVGPVAVTSVMTAQALYLVLPAHSSLATYAASAAALAGLVGLMLCAASVMRLGWLTQWLSRGVMAGFMTGAAGLIILNQAHHVLGAPLQHDQLLHLLTHLWQHPPQVHLATLMLGLLSIAVLWAVRRYATRGLIHLGVPTAVAGLVSKLTPLLWVVAMTVLSASVQFHALGVHVVGALPAGLPPLQWPSGLSVDQLLQLLPSAGLIALIAFISSASVAQTVARQRQEPFDANQELAGLGLANLGSALSQGFPVTGGFSRTAVNLEAGAQTPLAGVVCAAVMLIVLWQGTGWFYHLPLAVLAAGIVVAVFGLIDLQTFVLAWRVDRADAWAYLGTLTGVVLLGLQQGLIFGLLVCFAMLLRRSRRPHVAVLGQVGQTAHFRSVTRHNVHTWPSLLIVRIDDSLYFANIDSVTQYINHALQQQPHTQHVILVFSAVNYIDLAAQGMLESLNQQLLARHVRLHWTDIKGPVMDHLQQTACFTQLSGAVYLSTFAAVEALKPPAPLPEYHL
ncbi:MAG: hypothetical protein RL180_1299 [Pseudomonadota bacterium]